MKNNTTSKLKKIPNWHSIKWLGNIHAHKSLDEWLTSMDKEGLKVVSIRSVYGKDQPFILIKAGGHEELFEEGLIVMSIKQWLAWNKDKK